MSPAAALSARLKPCGPVVDAGAAERAREALGETAPPSVWPALAPVFAASPYLTGLARRSPERLKRILDEAPERRLEAILKDTRALETSPGDPGRAREQLRRLKGDLHLLTALADLGGVWDLDAVTSALTRFADAAVRAALATAAAVEIDKGRLVATEGGERGPDPSL